MHVEEEGSERTFWRIGIMLPLLALLLVWCFCDDRLGWTDGAVQVSETEEGVLSEFGQGRVNIEACAMFTEDRVGVLDIG